MSGTDMFNDDDDSVGEKGLNDAAAAPGEAGIPADWKPSNAPAYIIWCKEHMAAFRSVTYYTHSKARVVSNGHDAPASATYPRPTGSFAIFTAPMRTALTRVSLGRVGTRHIRIARPPAGRLVGVLKWVLTPRAFEGMIAAYVAQEQSEYFKALCRHEIWYSRFIVVRMYGLIGYNALCALTTSVTRLIRRSG
jgi:hypothetical protein